jgi:predicted dienelactone hydrolase
MKGSILIRLISYCGKLLLVVAAFPVVLLAYDPLQVDSSFAAKTLDLKVHDSKRNRDIPLRIYLPAGSTSEPVVLFSHGLGGTRNGNVYCGQHWAARGYVAVFVQHPGSDDSVWRDKPAEEIMAGLREAASLENFKLRNEDIPAVLDALAQWDRDANNPLHGRMNLAKVGMSGHSFGAITTQAVSGEKFPLTGTKFTDPRIKAAIAMSPSSPRHGTAEDAFSSVHIPWLLMTGTKDNAPIGQTDLKSRLAVYPALHGAPKYEVVLNNAEHSAFTDRALPGDRETRNPNHRRVILGLSTAFWDAYLRDDSKALEWLNGSGPRSIMEPEDQWTALAPTRPR